MERRAGKLPDGFLEYYPVYLSPIAHAVFNEVVPITDSEAWE